MSKEILKMQNITKIYGNGFVANKDISFTVKEKEIHALVGENGAGKTTLFNLLTKSGEATGNRAGVTFASKSAKLRVFERVQKLKRVCSIVE